MAVEKACPFADCGPDALEMMGEAVLDVSDDHIKEELMDWYITSGFRGCLFNKIAARDAKRDEFEWVVDVENGGIDELADTEKGDSLIDRFRSVIDPDSSTAELASFVFPNITNPRDYARLLHLLVDKAPDIFAIFPEQDIGTLGPESTDGLFVGVQFRIILPTQDQPEAVYSYPMVYTPDSFTTYARRFKYFTITFNPRNHKMNPETPDSYIGVDDIDLRLDDNIFDKLLERSLDVRGLAHSSDGDSREGTHYDRKLFRAHNGLVLPLDVWEREDD